MLNQQQQEVVQHISGPILVVAGAGSGKTRALTHRIANLISEGNAAKNILAVTFTNKAAEEMKTRIKKILLNEKNLPIIGTFHSIGVRILRSELKYLEISTNFSILDSDESKNLVKRIIKEVQFDENIFVPKKIYSRISFLKNNFLTSENFPKNSDFDEKVYEIFYRYEKKKKEIATLDFDDLILLPVKIFQKFPEILQKYQNFWKFISVDEFQDTNAIQFEFLKLLSAKNKNLCVIGDSDQSIYSFRGADINNILNFSKNFPETKTVKLEVNYRSTQNILDAADYLISKNFSRVPKKMHTDSGSGEKLEIFCCQDEKEEAEQISKKILDLVSNGKKFSDFAVLVRTNAQTRVIEESAIRNSIPYQILDGISFYSRKEIKDILAYLKFIVNPQDEISFLRILNFPPRKIGKTTISRLLNFSKLRGILLSEILDHLDFCEGIPTAAKKSLQTFSQKIKSLRKICFLISPADLILKIIQEFEIEKFYENSQEITRFENILELCSVAKKFDNFDFQKALPQFLEEVALISDTDKIKSIDKILILTLHASKGLEFPIVFIPGLEEGLFPHSRSLFNPNEIEEERRLMYVGMTRAREKLFLLHAESRLQFGNFSNNPESRFLSEIPENLILQDDNQENNNLDEPYFSPDISEFSVGDKIFHQKFGIGKILEISGDILLINFETVGQKKILLTIVPIQKIDD